MVNLTTVEASNFIEGIGISRVVRSGSVPFTSTIKTSYPYFRLHGLVNIRLLELKPKDNLDTMYLKARSDEIQSTISVRIVVYVRLAQ